MTILHYIRCYANDQGAYYYLKKLKQYLGKYNVKQYYIAYEAYKGNTMNSDDEKIPLLSEIDIKKYLEEIKPDIIQFHDNYAYYIQKGTSDHKEFYQLCDNMCKIRTIHDYSQAICPNYLTENHGECKGIMTNQCIENRCITKEKYEDYSRYINSLKKYDGITVFSKDTMEKLIKMGFERNKVFQLPAFIEKPETVSRQKENIIAYVGRLVQQKGVDYLIEAVSQLKSTDWKLIIAGKGDPLYTKKLIKKVYKCDLEDKIQFVGYLSQEKMKELYLKSKIVAFPSISHETYGFSGAEAISYGDPVVAFDIDGINSWLKNNYNGIVVPLIDVQKFASALDTLLSCNDIYNKLHRNCLEWSNNLSLENQIEQMYHYYEQLLNDNCKREE